MDEYSLVQRAVSGDKEAFAALYVRCRDSLYRYAYFKLGNDSDAQDAVSACIVEAYRSIGGLRCEKSFRSWIFKILYRSCCMYVREQSEQNARADLSELERLPAEDGGLRSVELREALNTLSSDDRDIVLLAVAAGYTSAEISAITGIKAGTVRSRLSRSLKKLRAFLE